MVEKAIREIVFRKKIGMTSKKMAEIVARAQRLVDNLVDKSVEPVVVADVHQLNEIAYYVEVAVGNARYIG